MKREFEFIILLAEGVAVACVLVATLVTGAVVDKALRVVGI